MTTRLLHFWHVLSRQRQREPEVLPELVAQRPRATPTTPLQIAPNDPLIAYFLSAPGAVEIGKLSLESPALHALQAAGVQLAVPLVSQGELIGVLNLGPRLSQQDYSVDDRRLLDTLATQAAPALRVAQLVREQQAEARERERMAQELRVARLIQQTLLPKTLPQLQNWHLAAYYQPAREVGGDFYDFLELSDGRLGLVIGDVTDKGVPAALVMATTRSVLRSVAQRIDSPGQVLEHANDLLYPDIPQNMFVTCQYAILDPKTGRLLFANAGHDLPYRCHGGGADELRATGMPLGLMPGMRYEEKEIVLEPGETVLFYSDGLVEAHNPQRDMFSFGRVRDLVAAQHCNDDVPLVEVLLRELEQFTGADWEQEDDITLVTLQREEALARHDERGEQYVHMSHLHNRGESWNHWRTLTAFTVDSAPGNERQAMREVATAVQPLHLPTKQLDRLNTAVAEATMNAMEHGNKYQRDIPVKIEVRASDHELAVRITDQGGDQPIPDATTPDLEAKLASQQTPRGWGLFLIKSMVDELNVSSDAAHHTMELVMHLKGDDDARQTA
jgi:serine phosphatase RsbU (regulator of sigma subunit)/anti-sigma regulatory factor (Ser/Thr protein kinase)